MLRTMLERNLRRRRRPVKLAADRPIKVAVVAPHFLPKIGGVESYAGEVARALQRTAGFEVVVITASDARCRVVDQWEGIEVIRLGSLFWVSNAPGNPLWLYQVPRHLRRLGVDVLHAHAPVPGLSELAALVAGRRKVVFTYHAGTMSKGENRVNDFLLRTWERLVLPLVFARSQRLVAVSPVALSYRTGRAVLVPPGVDSTRFVRPIVEEQSLRITYVGRVERASRWKGVDVLLAAMPYVLKRVPAAELEVVGGGDDLDRLRGVAEETGIDHAVRWRGPLSGDDLVRAYQAAAVVALPSLTEAESFGMTLVEAMACGRPVVGSDVGGIPSVIRNGVDGVLVPPGDAEALGDALADLLADPDRRLTMGRAGRRAAEEGWDWQNSLDKTIRLISEAARGVPRTP